LLITIIKFIDNCCQIINLNREKKKILSFQLKQIGILGFISIHPLLESA